MRFALNTGRRDLPPLFISLLSHFHNHIPIGLFVRQMQESG